MLVSSHRLSESSLTHGIKWSGNTRGSMSIKQAARDADSKFMIACTLAFLIVKLTSKQLGIHTTHHTHVTLRAFDGRTCACQATTFHSFNLFHQTCQWVAWCCIGWRRGQIEKFDELRIFSKTRFTRARVCLRACVRICHGHDQLWREREREQVRSKVCNLTSLACLSAIHLFIHSVRQWAFTTCLCSPSSHTSHHCSKLIEIVETYLLALTSTSSSSSSNHLVRCVCRCLRGRSHPSSH